MPIADKFTLTGTESEYSTAEFVNAEEPLHYVMTAKEGTHEPVFYNRKDMWRYIDLIPLKDKDNVVALGEGKTSLIRVKELEKYLNGAKLFCKNESENPTGTFKDREASYVISKAKEFGLKKIVFHSTGNTGRAYSMYASQVGIESYFFLPISCMEKCDDAMKKDSIHIIAVDGHFDQVGSVAKSFAKKNGLITLAPLHDKLEGKATLAYEQYEELPEATMYVQTIAGGYGILGFLLGHKRLKEFGMSPKNYSIPRIIAIQAEDNCTIAKGMEVGEGKLTADDLILPKLPFEKTLQSSNPLKTFSEVKEAINETKGLVGVASIEKIQEIKDFFEASLLKHDIHVSFENEKSPHISYAGLIALAKKNLITSKDVIYMVITGKGCEKKSEMLDPEAIVKPMPNGYEVVSSSDYLKGLL